MYYMSWNAIGNCLSRALGRFPFNPAKLSKIWKQRKTTEIFLKSFQKFRKLLNFSEVRIIQPKLNGKKTSGKLGIPREVVFFFLTFSPNLHRIFNFSFQTFRKILVITSEFVKQPVYRYLCLHEAHWSLIKKKIKMKLVLTLNVTFPDGCVAFPVSVILKVKE